MTKYDNDNEEMVMTCDLCSNDEIFYGDFKSCIASSKESGWKTFKEGEKWCNKCPAHESEEPVVSKPKVQLPSIGRIVHYVNEGGDHRAAIITDLNGFSGSCDLQIFPLSEGFITGIEMDDHYGVRTWHWPEKV